jgi:hypothetical protein
MQGLWFRVLPAAWNHARNLMPSHSKNRSPSSSMAAVSCGIGGGAESGAGPLDHRAKYVGARRISNQKNWLPVVDDHAARFGDLPPEVFSSHGPRK